uniref:Ionotropic receptor 8 n=1 Tax=Conogethes punctiferalis TaxID=1133088 RepID=A0A1X9PDC9_CONPF|nr:ionotropic receptor 8 [Conogethes punctiferalis]
MQDMKTYEVLFILLMSCFSLIIANPINEFRMIADVIKDSNKSTSVVAHLCWNPSKQIQMASYLHNSELTQLVLLVNESWADIKEPQHRERLLLIADIDCPSTTAFFKMANETKKFSLPYRWLIIGKAVNKSTDVTADFDGLHLLPDSDVIIAQKNDNNSFYMSMIYKIKIKSKWIIEDFGTWTTNTGLIKSDLAQYSTSTRRKNFHGESFTTAMVIFDNKTISNLFDLSDILTDVVTKSSFRQIVPLYGYMNASQQHIYSKTWGYYRNGTFDGMIAELTVGDADLGGTVLIVTWDRMQVVDYLSKPGSITVKFVFREPPLSYQNNLYLLPFKVTVWYCMGAFVLVMGFILYITALWENKKMGENQEVLMDN